MTETNTIRREKNRLIKTKIETKTKQKQNNMMKGGQGNKTYWTKNTVLQLVSRPLSCFLLLFISFSYIFPLPCHFVTGHQPIKNFDSFYLLASLKLWGVLSFLEELKTLFSLLQYESPDKASSTSHGTFPSGKGNDKAMWCRWGDKVKYMTLPASLLAGVTRIKTCNTYLQHIVTRIKNLAWMRLKQTSREVHVWKSASCIKIREK